MRRKHDKGITMLENAVALAIISIMALTVFLSVSAVLKASFSSDAQLNINRFEASIKMCSLAQSTQEALEFYLDTQINEGESTLYLDSDLRVCNKEDSSYTLEIDNNSGKIELLLLDKSGKKLSICLDS